jgi:lysophospholipase L1-like esterase
MLKTTLLAILLVCSITSFKTKEITWTAIGDSITYLNDHPNETGNRITKGYMTMVTEKLPNIHYFNQGHNGWTTVGIAKSIETLGIQKSDIYSIFLGTNDWWAGLPLGTITDYTNNTGIGTTFGAYRIIIDKIRSLNANASIVLITPLQRSDFVYVGNGRNNAYGSYKDKKGQNLSQFAAAVKEIAALENFSVVDLYNKRSLRLEKQVNFKRLKNPQTGSYENYKYPKFIDIPYNPDSDEYPYPMEAINTTYDGLHPSDKGYEVISSMLIKVFKKQVRN